MARASLMFLAVCVALHMDSTALTAQEKKPNPDLSLKLAAAKQSIAAGTEPVLRLTIENVGKADEKILKPRADLQDTYYDLVITKEGKPVNWGERFRIRAPFPKRAF